jgi:hypothetical protein
VRARRLVRQARISGLIEVKPGRTAIRVPGVRVADDPVKPNFRRMLRTSYGVADIT